ncbi:MAG: 3-phosphoshikimate 1-carboxyvinyltransferase [Deltaproteobacteria bacterium]|nr:3-phosphoshikimate 1-carboxyvinyltransferase [Deltaproteobacteria bacterium]
MNDVLVVEPGAALRGRVQVPGDKSISHRALLFNAFAEGRAKVTGLLDADDVRSTASCLRALGAEISDGGGEVVGVAGRFAEPQDVLDCGNSGTTMRLLTGLLAGQPLHAVLTGDATLRRRPMRRVSAPLRLMGAQIDGRDQGERAPLSIRGQRPLRGLTYDSPVASAQVKTALILAAMQAEGELVFSEPFVSRDHTERLLGAMGVVIHRDGARLVVPGGQVPRAVDVVVPGDISSAAFFLVAASICEGSELVLEGVGLNPTRDGVLEALDAMGADVRRENERVVSGEPVGDLRVRSASLRGVTIGGGLIPRLIDELPVLAVAAAFAEGETIIRDAQELRVKESDRVATTVGLLRAFGVEAEERPDGLRVVGRGRAGLNAASVATQGDHRVGMAAAVLALALPAGLGPSTVHSADCIRTSFPSFPDLLERLRAR